VVLEKIKTFLKIDEAMAEGRIHHIDALKGFVIILIVWGHTIQFDPNNLNNMYLSFPYPTVIPLFMLLSGFGISRQLNSTFLNYMKKNAVRLMVPFFVWYLIYFIYLSFQKDVNLFSHLYLIIESPANGLWFLWVLFWSSLLLFAALKIARYRNWLQWENYFVVAAILLSKISSSGFFGFTEIKAYFVYYAAGFFIHKYFDVLADKRNIFYAISIVVFPILICFWQHEQLPTFHPALLQLVHNEKIARLIVSIYKYVVAISGMVFFSFVMERINKTWFYFFLCWIGTMTLDIYVCQQYFIFFGESSLFQLLGLCPFTFGNSVWQYIAATVVSLTCALALTLLLMKRFKITRLLLLGQSR